MDPGTAAAHTGDIIAGIVTQQPASQVGKFVWRRSRTDRFWRILPAGNRAVRCSRCSSVRLLSNRSSERGAMECRDRHGVVEHIVQPAKTSGLGSDRQLRFQQFSDRGFRGDETSCGVRQVHRLRIPIDGQMPDREERSSTGCRPSRKPRRNSPRLRRSTPRIFPAWLARRWL